MKEGLTCSALAVPSTSTGSGGPNLSLVTQRTHTFIYDGYT